MKAVNSKILKSDENIISQTCTQFTSPFEIDTVRLFIHHSRLNYYDYNSLLALIDAKENSKGYEGRYKGFYIKVAEKGITMIGSFSNYYVGKNKVLPYFELRNAVERLGKELSLNLHKASLYRIDVNYNLITDKPINNYTHHLFTYLSKFERLEQSDGVIFKTTSKSIRFYNKTNELLNKNHKSVDNWYRIEYRILKNVKKNVEMKLMEDLYSFKKYKLLLNQFKNYFTKIKKQVIIKSDYTEFKTVKEFEKFIMLVGIFQLGGESSIRRMVEQLDKQKIFSNRKQKYRIVSKINDLLCTENITETNPLALELVEKFNFAYKQEIFKYSTQKIV